jgi:hypothetical protein
MAHTASLHLSHLPPTTSILTSLFTHVANAAYIRSQLLASNPDYDYAFIDASSILSTTHVLAAVERAVRDWSRGRGKSRNVHSEVVFCLGGSNNVSCDTVKRFNSGGTKGSAGKRGSRECAVGVWRIRGIGHMFRAGIDRLACPAGAPE